MRTPLLLLSSAAAPLLLIGGWLLAESRQPPGFDPITDPVSALAATDAATPAIMTVGFAGAALAYLTTAAALTEAARPGRLLLGLGGMALLAVAAFPISGAGTPAGHSIAAVACFVALAAWPAFGPASAGALRPSAFGPGTAGALRRPTSAVAAVELFVLLAGMGVTALTGGPFGLAERIVIAAESLWPLVVVLSLRVRARPLGAERRPGPALGSRDGRPQH
ncbi:DUF998 domain-containing protein [Actinoplanes sp. DH11]|uniref:DUF998 domain-containing protein n=1 Tax=Actinoplanes sp. DH11 TaxID=2857011 RepID=UPI001E2D17D7|nr:DUF998 domain-containing protein [Actinoplanes sp. DH11]